MLSCILFFYCFNAKNKRKILKIQKQCVKNEIIISCVPCFVFYFFFIEIWVLVFIIDKKECFVGYASNGKGRKGRFSKGGSAYIFKENPSV